MTLGWSESVGISSGPFPFATAPNRSILLTTRSAGFSPRPSSLKVTCTHLGLLRRLRVGDVDDMENQVRLLELLQCGPESVHHRWRQLVDEPNGVGQEHLGPSRKPDTPGHRVQGGEEPVLDDYFGFAQGIEQGALPGVGVTHQGYHREPGLLAAVHIGDPPPAHQPKLVLQPLDPPPDEAPVRLQLGLRRVHGCLFLHPGAPGGTTGPPAGAAGTGAGPAPPVAGPPGYARGERRCPG